MLEKEIPVHEYSYTTAKITLKQQSSVKGSLPSRKQYLMLPTLGGINEIFVNYKIINVPKTVLTKNEVTIFFLEEKEMASKTNLVKRMRHITTN